MNTTIKQIIMEYLVREDSSNVLGKGDQVSKFSQKLSQLMNKTDASGKQLNVVVDVMEFHHDTPPKLVGTFPVKDFSLKSFTVDVTGVGVVAFNQAGKTTTTELDLFCTNPRVK
jgi:hypothetical protein